MKTNKEKKGTIAGIISGASSGAYLGGGIGIAAGPLGAISGIIPGAIIGGIVGGLTGNRIGLELDTKNKKLEQKEYSADVVAKTQNFLKNQRNALEKIKLSQEEKNKIK